MKKEGFVKFLRKHSLSIEDAKNIAIEYATSDYDVAKSYFMEKYNITACNFYKIRDGTIIFCLVSKKIVKKIEEKTAANYQSHNPNETQEGSNEHFKKLYEKRNEFLNTRFSNYETYKVAEEYANGMSMKNLAKKYEIHEDYVGTIIYKAIVSNILTPDILISTKNRIKTNGKNSDKIEKIINDRLVFLASKLKGELDLIEYFILDFDNYFKSDKYVPDLKMLKLRHEEVSKKYQKIISNLS